MTAPFRAELKGWQRSRSSHGKAEFRKHIAMGDFDLKNTVVIRRFFLIEISPFLADDRRRNSIGDTGHQMVGAARNLAGIRHECAIACPKQRRCTLPGIPPFLDSPCTPLRFDEVTYRRLPDRQSV